MNKDILNIIFTLFLCIVFGSAAILALGFSRLAQFFPLYVSVAGTILSIIYLIVLLIHYNKIAPSMNGFLLLNRYDTSAGLLVILALFTSLVCLSQPVCLFLAFCSSKQRWFGGKRSSL